MGGPKRGTIRPLTDRQKPKVNGTEAFASSTPHSASVFGQRSGRFEATHSAPNWCGTPAPTLSLLFFGEVRGTRFALHL